MVHSFERRNNEIRLSRPKKEKETRFHVLFESSLTNDFSFLSKIIFGNFLDASPISNPNKTYFQPNSSLSDHLWSKHVALLVKLCKYAIQAPSYRTMQNVSIPLRVFTKREMITSLFLT